MHIDDFLSRLEHVKQTSDGWMARCPAHEDGRPSLHINEDTNGRILLHCFAGCLPSDITERMGLDMTALFQKDDPVFFRPTFRAPKVYKPYDGDSIAYSSDMTPAMKHWLKHRGLSPEAWEQTPGVSFSGETIAFGMYRDGKLVNAKKRHIPKGFEVEAGCELMPITFLTGADVMVVVEGEIDLMTVVEHGPAEKYSVMTPPNGSNATEEIIEKMVRQCERMRKVILAGDMDEPGQKLIERLSARIGHDRCYRVTWPEDCNDANDCLVKHGGDLVRSLLDNAQPYPVAGIFSVDDLTDALYTRFHNGPTQGMSTGWPGMDPLYTPRIGEMSILTGSPGSGKSSWLDAVIVNMINSGDDIQIAICSPEQQPLEAHLQTLVEIDTGKCFPSYRKPQQYWMTEPELEAARAKINYHISFVLPEEPTVDSVLAKFATESARRGIKLAIIDPWSEIDHSRPERMTEAEFIHESLRKIRKFGRDHQCHMVVVAHPTKLRKLDDGSYPVATPYDISGSAAWFNKADNCISVWRDRSNPGSAVDVHIQKIRFRDVGKIGRLSFRYNEINGRWEEWR